MTDSTPTILLMLITAAFLAFLSIPVVVVAIELVLATRYRSVQNMKDWADDTSASFVVVVPAHNESLVLGPTLTNLKAQVRDIDRILVVADNCTDDTKDIALAAGVMVTSRDDPKNRGKGFALAHALEYLSSKAPPLTIIIVDADCYVNDGCLLLLNSQCIQNRVPIQACYLMDAPPGATNLLFSAFTWRVKNLIRLRGSKLMGWPSILTGSGMAFPWDLISTANLAHGGLVEDMELGIDLTMSGNSPMFCESAVVRSTFAASRRAQVTQRSRWERGHINQIKVNSVRLLLSAIKRKSMQPLYLLLDLTVPPLFILALLLVFANIWTLSLYSFGVISLTPAIFSASLLILLIGSVGLAWRDTKIGGGRVGGIGSVLGFLSVKFSTYLNLALNRGAHWIKTDRDDE